MKMTEPSPGALMTIISEHMQWILPPEVIEQYGDYSDWKNVVGTGPWMLTDYVEGVSKTFTKNPNYWGFDEKYPENRLPYVDEIRALLMAEEATRLSAMRTGKVDIIHSAGGSNISSLDVVRSLQKTNPEIEVHSYYQRSFQSFTLNIRNAPFDDVRVRHALQMALDLETINDTYYAGFADVKDPRWNSTKGYYTPFEERPEELKQYYRYDPEGAEKLLDEAGYPRGADGVRFQTTLQHRDVIDLGYVEIAASYWADIGVDVTINILDSATYAANKGEHNYEMATGDMAFSGNPAIFIGFYRHDTLFLREWFGVETPELTAAYDAFFAATTIEEQQRAFKEFDMILIKQHNQIWGPLAPQFQANQPWVMGYNGEFGIGELQFHTILARLWIDSELKEAMGR
jgi:peptide/nickel transport system substrate-binding protein